MWTRILRLFSSGALAYSNPMGFFVSLAMIILAPYLIYLFWGSLIFILLMTIALFFGIRFIMQKVRKQRFS